MNSWSTSVDAQLVASSACICSQLLQRSYGWLWQREGLYRFQKGYLALQFLPTTVSFPLVAATATPGTG
jgi:hypothetical protein